MVTSTSVLSSHTCVYGFTSTTSRSSASISSSRAVRTTTWQRAGSNNNNNDGNHDDDNDTRQKFDDMLDAPFFDPEDESIKEGSLKGWFAGLVKDDYATAEALYAGLFFSILLVLTQEMLRYVMYGGDYVPFTRGGGGKLF